MSRKIKMLMVAGFFSLIIFIYASLSTIFIALLLGMLVIPPVLVFITILKEGVPIIGKELKNLIDSGKSFFIISISRESITLQPEFK